MDTLHQPQAMLSYERGNMEPRSSTHNPAYPSPSTNSDSGSFAYASSDGMGAMYSYSHPLSACSSSTSHSAMVSPMPSEAWSASMTTSTIMPGTIAECWPAQYDHVPAPQSPVPWSSNTFSPFGTPNIMEGRHMVNHRLASPQRSSTSSHDEMMRSRSGSEILMHTPIKAENEWVSHDDIMYHNGMTISPRTLQTVDAYNHGYPPMHPLLCHEGGLGIRTPVSTLSTDDKDSKKSERRGSSGCSTTRRRKGGRTKSLTENATFRCEICGKVFQREYNRKAHMQTHNPSRARPQACEYPNCDKSFVRRTDLMRHQESVHIKNRPFECTACDARFSRKDTLQRHVEDGCPRRFDVKRHAAMNEARSRGALY
ncbi:hypothetical protein EJ05DRAFT_156793 [Pseudovirgaria hyperparasitica]|uniref:C2H2 type master regulator of conidiophore development brlA n=1 Tax=Pseudovirgaria hyperparasitica TaxID=470096 RepID=A0A6A6VW21_9PEZI|nr:uncharacterized protein EJ05DRAFT_156793 [Pseudovirgaria hyperparasitica]KAF2753840.1 hypothetical protein EJ05DRAFT_156793 [Pseudovirgaria hyperparasitica]